MASWAGWVGAYEIKSRPGFAQAYVYGALGGLAGMVVAGMLGDWVLPFFYNVGLAGSDPACSAGFSWVDW